MQVPFSTSFVPLPSNVSVHTTMPSEDNDLLKPIRYAVGIDDEGTIWKYIRCWKRQKTSRRLYGWVRRAIGNIREG